MIAKPRPCTCLRLRRASRAITQLYDDALAPAGLRATQFALLRTLERDGTLTISSLAQALLLDRTALSRNLEPLAAQGLVGVATGSDARVREVALTEAGRAALSEAAPLWNDAQERVARRVGRDRLDTLYAVLGDLESLHPGQSGQGQ